MNRLVCIIFGIALAFLLIGCGKNIKKIQDYIDKNLKVFKATDSNMAKIIANERRGREALLKISKKSAAAKKKIRDDDEALIKETLKGRKIERNALKGLRAIIKALE